MVLKVIFSILIIFILSANSIFGQENDSLPYQLFKDRVVLFTDLGFNSAPFTLKDDFGSDVTKISYKNNVKAVLGFGIAYKWLSVRLGFALAKNIKNEKKFGNTDYFDLGLKLNIKQVFINIDFKSYTGYVIKNEYHWNDTLTESTPNGIYPKTGAANFSANAWYFRSENFNMNAVLGKKGLYTGSAKTWYLKSSMNYFGISNTEGALIPEQISDSSDLLNAQVIGAFDIGVIPGYAYVNRIDNWQFAIFGGLGGVIQSKFYTTDSKTRTFQGLAPRIDFRIVGGYNKPRYFVLLSTNFDMKSITIQDLNYNQNFYSAKIIAGIRLYNKKTKRKG